MSFPKFPKFRRLVVTDKSAYLKYYKKLNEPCSDFCFDDVMIWLDFNDDLEVCNLNGNLVLQFSDVLDNNARYYLLLGEENLDNTLDKLFEWLVAHEEKPKLSYIPEQAAKKIQSLNRPDIKVEEDPNNFDYVYNIDNLVAMRGKIYENLRRRINYFTRDNQNIHFKHFNLRDKEDRNTILFYIHKWSKSGDYLRNDPEKWEYSVIKRHLSLSDHLPLHAYGIYADDELAAVIMFNRPPHREWAIGNHVKCNYSYRGIYGYAVYSLAIILQQLGVKWLNYEQDLGREGLRQIKKVFNPEKFIHRYTVISLVDREGTKAQ